MIIVVARMNTTTFTDMPSAATLNAVPEAGGCSVSITTIKKIDIPTARE
jgi:hypothetical protein